MCVFCFFVVGEVFLLVNVKVVYLFLRNNSVVFFFLGL